MVQPRDKNEDDGEDDDGNDDHYDEDEEDGINDDEDILDMPPPWSPKLFIDRDRYQDLCPNGEKTVFYEKCKVDYYAPCSQVDGLIKRLSIYEDYKRLVIREIRSFYANRRDKLVVRRRFPYDFRMIEEYMPSEKTNYWKKFIVEDGVRHRIYFYHHRNKDGLIYREEIIGKKTVEKYKNREDKLVYRSVTFVHSNKIDPTYELVFPDNHCGDVVIKKMSQKFELDPEKSAEEQMRKTEFNLEKKKVDIYYHFKEGKVTAKNKSYHRDDLIGKATHNEMNEKETEESALQQEHKFINNMERECIQYIKEHEKAAKAETFERSENERNI
jgi:hypothetical protein